ncbi:unnamed protein product [Sphacelaria rigidula]
MRAELNAHNTAGIVSSDEIPNGVNAITAKLVSSWKNDANGSITNTKARLETRKFGQGLAIDCLETFAATPAMTSIKLAMTVAVQEIWLLYHFYVTQSFSREKVDTNVFMKLQDGCGPLTGDTVRLEKSIYGITQVGRQWSLLLDETLMEDAGMSQSKS